MMPFSECDWPDIVLLHVHRFYRLPHQIVGREAFFLPIDHDRAGTSRRPGNTLDPLLLRLAETVRANGERTAHAVEPAHVPPAIVMQNQFGTMRQISPSSLAVYRLPSGPCTRVRV